MKKRNAYPPRAPGKLKEVRPGVVRTSLELPTELEARLIVAARARGVYPSVLKRAIWIQWLEDHTVVPPFSPPPIEVSLSAYEVARTLKGGNDKMDAHFGPTSAHELANIFGWDEKPVGPRIGPAQLTGGKA